MVKKPNWSSHPYSNYRHLNLMTKPDHYLLPNMANLISNLKNTRIFSKLGILKGCFQLLMHLDSVQKPTVITFLIRAPPPDFVGKCRVVEGALIHLFENFENNKSFTQEDVIINILICKSAKINLNSLSITPYCSRQIALLCSLNTGIT